MKLNKFLWSLAVLGLASCSADKLADEPIDPNLISDGTSRYLAISLTSNNSGSRAEVYEESTTDDANEREIKKIRFYFFDATGNAVDVKNASGDKANPSMQNYYDVPSEQILKETSKMDNIDMNYTAVVVISTAAGDTRPSQMVALVNVPTYPTSVATLADLEKIVESYAYTNQLAATGSTLTGSGLVMASSVYKSGSVKTYAVAVPAMYTTQDLAKAYPVEVYVERVNAKVRMHLGTSFAIDAANAKSDASKADNDITVYNVKDNSTDNNNVTVKIGAGTKDVLVNFGGWYVTAEMPQSFLIKHINGGWTDGLFTGWNKADWYRSFWAINPSLATDPRVDGNMRSLLYKDYKATGNEVSATANYFYVQENAADAVDGTKVTVNGGETGLVAKDNHCTKVLVKATIGYKDDAGVFVPLDYAEWAGNKYVVADNNLETAMLSALNYWIVDNTNGTQTVGSAKYRKIGPADVKVVTASGSDLTTHVSDASAVVQEKRYKCHLELINPDAWTDVYEITGEGAGITATAIDVTGEDDQDVVNAALAAGAGDIKYWKGGQTYYFFDIKHLVAAEGATKIDDAGSNAAGKFGVVRNHVYDCTINGVFGLGTPVYDPDEVIIPETVIGEESFVAVQLKVLSWRVVSQNVNLGE